MNTPVTSYEISVLYKDTPGHWVTIGVYNTGGAELLEEAVERLLAVWRNRHGPEYPAR